MPVRAIKPTAASTAGNGNAEPTKLLIDPMAARYDLAPLIEPMLIQDVFVSGVARIEDAGGGLFRLVSYVNQEDEAGRPYRVIVSRLIVPVAAFEGGIRKIREAVATAGDGLLAGETMGRA